MRSGLRDGRRFSVQSFIADALSAFLVHISFMEALALACALHISYHVTVSSGFTLAYLFCRGISFH